MKKFLCVFAFLVFAFTAVFAADNMRIFSKEEGESITGFKGSFLPEEVKINILYPSDFNNARQRFDLVFLFDTEEYKIENLKQIFYSKKSKNPQTLIAAFRFKNDNLTQEQFNSFLEEIFAFFELNYKAQSEPSKRIILAKNNFALFALNALNNKSNYFLNLGMILDNTTAFPILNDITKKPVRIFTFSQRDNILNLQNLFLAAGLKPLQNFFFNIAEDNSFANFDLRYFLNSLPKIKSVKPVLPKEILQETPFYLKVKTTYGFLDFLPTDIKFAPPVLIYDANSAYLKVILSEPVKVKISGVFKGTAWSKKVQIAN